jgi:hypothetical protein
MELATALISGALESRRLSDWKPATADLRPVALRSGYAFPADRQSKTAPSWPAAQSFFLLLATLTFTFPSGSGVSVSRKGHH